MKRILIIALFIAPQGWTADSFLTEKVDGNRIEKSYDLNGDKKADFIEVYQDGKIIEKREDNDFDGDFEKVTTFFYDSSAEYFKVIEQKKTSKIPRKKISYWEDKKLRRSFSLTQIDTNNDGKWDQEYKTSSEIHQKKEQCEQTGLNFADDLSETSLKAAALTDEYTLTKWGHKVHKSCLSTDTKDWFLTNSEKAITEGLSCLNRLGKAGGLGAAKNNISLGNLLKNQTVQIICNETGYDWGNSTIAHATTSGKDDNGSQLKHPGISVNPAMVKEYKSQGEEGRIEFVRTIFHEQLHNLGYLHGHDVEYPYACEKCCFSNGKDSDDLQKASCKVCSGSYPDGSSDLAYLKDITEFAQLNYDTTHSLSTALSYVKQKPGDINGLSYLALNLSGVFDPVGAYLADKIESDNKLTADQQNIINKARSYKNDPLLKPFEKSSKIIADAFYLSYKGRDPSAALQLLKKELPVIKAQLASPDTEENSKYVKDSLRASMKKLIYDVWLDDYSGKISDPKLKESLGNLAYDLQDKLKF